MSGIAVVGLVLAGWIGLNLAYLLVAYVLGTLRENRRVREGSLIFFDPRLQPLEDEAIARAQKFLAN